MRCPWWTVLFCWLTPPSLPQTRFVLGKALAAKMPVIICVNKTDRPDARIDEVVEEAQDLLLELASTLDDEAAEAAEQLLDLPVLYTSGREGKASTENPGNGNVPDSEDLQPLFDVLYEVLPEPSADVEGHCKPTSQTLTLPAS